MQEPQGNPNPKKIVSTLQSRQFTADDREIASASGRLVFVSLFTIMTCPSHYRNRQGIALPLRLPKIRRGIHRGIVHSFSQGWSLFITLSPHTVHVHVSKKTIQKPFQNQSWHIIMSSTLQELKRPYNFELAESPIKIEIYKCLAMLTKNCGKKMNHFMGELLPVVSTILTNAVSSRSIEYWYMIYNIWFIHSKKSWNWFCVVLG